jgi:hypothetical protein
MSVTTTQVLGVVLVITGLMMVAYQMRKTSLDNAGATSNRSGFQLKTTYHGIILSRYHCYRFWRVHCDCWLSHRQIARAHHPARSTGSLES